MSALKTKLTEDMKQAMRDHDSAKLNTIRFLLSELKNWEIDHGEQDDQGVTQVIARELKKLQDAQADYQKAGRTDLIQEQEQKMAVIKSYLPQQLSDEELQKIVDEVVAGAAQKEFGPIMKAVMAKVQGKADGARVSAMVKAAL